MAFYQKLPVVVEAITFNEFTTLGRNQGVPLIEGFPWSFEYKGVNVTHENNECYLIPTLEGVMNFSPDDMLITGVDGEIYPCKIDIFNKTYKQIKNGN